MTDLDARLWGLPSTLAARAAGDADHDPALLPAHEQARMAGFGLAARRRQFVLGRVAARTLAGARLGVEPHAVGLRVGADGAPEIAGVHVSIAHTGRAGESAALAAVADVPVGVDLEHIAPRRADLWRRILSPDEHPLLDALGGPTDDAQTLLWTLKEAVLKGQRTGFRAGAQTIRLEVEAAGAVPEQGVAQAVSDTSGAWRVAFGRDGDLWLAVAWPARQ